MPERSDRSPVNPEDVKPLPLVGDLVSRAKQYFDVEEFVYSDIQGVQVKEPNTLFHASDNLVKDLTKEGVDVVSLGKLMIEGAISRGISPDRLPVISEGMYLGQKVSWEDWLGDLSGCVIGEIVRLEFPELKAEENRRAEKYDP